MKKLSIWLLGAMLALALTACSSKTEEGAGESMTAPDGGPVQTESAVSEKVPEANPDPVQVVTIYHSNDDATGAKQSLDGVDGEVLTAEGLVDKLIEYGVLEEGTEVNDFNISDKTGTLDLSQVPTNLGTSAEQILLICIGNTFTENFSLDQLKLLVNGDNYSSGHIVQEDEDYLTFNSRYKTLGE